MKGAPDVPFYKTPTFFICLAALAVVIILFIKVEPKADAQGGGPRRPLVQVARDQPAKVKDALKWDFGFIPIYVASTCLICFLVAGLTGAPLRFTRLVILVVIVTSLFDFAENLVLLHIINSSQSSGWVSAARVLEILKLVSPIIGAVYVVAVLVWRVVSAVRR
jgi:hypothetical protein